MYVCAVQVLLDRLAQDREKQMLEKENAQLKALLKQYLDGNHNSLTDMTCHCGSSLVLGISVHNETLTHANPLLVVNHRTNIPRSASISLQLVCTVT